mgnify:CR=1 FL=1
MAARASLLLLLALGGACGLPSVPRLPLRARRPIMEGTSPPEPAPWLSPLPSGDALDRKITSLALPAIVSFLILPISQATDLFWVGRMGEALAVAGQASANQMYSTLSWVTNTIPTVTVPVVAKATAAGEETAVQEALGEAFFISFVIGVVCTALVWRFNRQALSALGNPMALSFALAYTLGRIPGVVAEAVSLVGFAACRGVMDTVTPLKVSFASNLVNVILDPLLIFNSRMGILGAGLATTVSQIFSAVTYLTLLLKRRLVRWQTICRVPSRASLARLAAAGGAVQIRSIALNLAFIGITKTVQSLDQTGTAAAAHAITAQLWQLGGVVLFALSTVASIIIPAELNRKGGGVASARAAASRLMTWGLIFGAALGCAQLLALPLLSVFSPLVEVQRAAVVPSMIGAVLQLLNGITFVGEGVMVGTQSLSLIHI